MAYTQGTVVKTATPAPDRINPITIRWTDTEAAAGSEAAIPNLPKSGTIKRYTATLVGGTASTINPSIGPTAGYSASSQQQVMAAPGAAAFIDVTGPFYFNSDEGLFVRSNPDAGTDNTVDHQLLIVPGWSE
jgi:hypothetical protein